jgi:hypothetical protein
MSWLCALVRCQLLLLWQLEIQVNYSQLRERLSAQHVAGCVLRTGIVSP